MTALFVGEVKVSLTRGSKLEDAMLLLCKQEYRMSIDGTVPNILPLCKLQELKSGNGYNLMYLSRPEPVQYPFSILFLVIVT